MSQDAKTAADVADKALDKVSGALSSMVDALKRVAPHAWEVMVRQQFVEGCVSIATAVLLAAIVITFCVWVCRNVTKSDIEEFGTSCFVALIGGVFALFLTVGACTEAREGALKVGNPEYYAIKELLEVAK